MLKALGSGVAGALALTALHETVRRLVPSAPRMDVLGKRAIAHSLQAVGQEPPSKDRLHELALFGDVVANSLYYSLVGAGDSQNAYLRGAALGLGAGIGALVLPGPLGLGKAPSNRTTATQVMTVGWYLFGGLVSAAVYRQMGEE